MTGKAGQEAGANELIIGEKNGSFDSAPGEKPGPPAPVLTLARRVASKLPDEETPYEMPQAPLALLGPRRAD